MFLGWFFWRGFALFALTANLSCGSTAPHKVSPQRATRPQPPAAGSTVPLRFHLLGEGETRRVLAVHQVEQSAEWSEGKGGKTSIKCAFEAERTIKRRGARHQDTVLYVLQEGSNADAQKHELRGARVLVQQREGSAQLTVNGRPATEDQRAAVAGLVAIDTVERCLQGLLPASGTAHQGERWSPDPHAVQRMLLQFGAPENMHATELISEFSEVVACDDGYCAHILTKLVASAAERATLEGHLHFWLRLGDVAPVRRLAWELTLTEQNPKGNGLEKRHVTQREDVLIMPPHAPNQEQP